MGLGTVLGFGVYGIPGLFRIPCIASGSGDCHWIKSAKGVSGTSNQRHAGGRQQPAVADRCRRDGTDLKRPTPSTKE